MSGLVLTLSFKIPTEQREKHSLDLSMNMSTRKPLPLKQRTSSVDGRRDYTTKTWTSLVGLLKLREFVITVDHFSIWKRHMAWAMESGKDLREYMTQRYASSMVFMSLLLSTELGVLFNSAGVTTQVRQSLMNERHDTISFWIGIFIIFSAILTLLSLIATFTAWSLVSAISDSNAHCILRSSIGQYVAELPGRFIVGAIYSFMIWLTLFFFLLLPLGFWSILLLVMTVGLFVHTIFSFSAFGRIIMHTGAMGSKRIFDASFERSLLPHSLHANLLTKAEANLANKTSILRQYRSKSRPIDRNLSVDELSGHLSDDGPPSSEKGTPQHTQQVPVHKTHVRRRTESLVKFADGYDTNGERFAFDGLTPAAEGSTTQMTPKNQEITISSSLQGAMSALTTDESRKKWPPPPRRPASGLPRPDSRQLVKPFLKVTHPTRKPAREIANDDGNDSLTEKWLNSSSQGSLEGLVIEQRQEQQPQPLGQHDRLLGLDGSQNESPSDESPLAIETLLDQGSQPVSLVSSSVVSSLANSSEEDDDHLTEEEKFDREYGDLFGPEGYRSPEVGAGRKQASSWKEPPASPNNKPSQHDAWTDQDDDNDKDWQNAIAVQRNHNDGKDWYNETARERNYNDGNDDERRRLLDRMEKGNYNSIQE